MFVRWLCGVIPPPGVFFGSVRVVSWDTNAVVSVLGKGASGWEEEVVLSPLSLKSLGTEFFPPNAMNYSTGFREHCAELTDSGQQPIGDGGIYLDLVIQKWELPFPKTHSACTLAYSTEFQAYPTFVPSMKGPTLTRLLKT